MRPSRFAFLLLLWIFLASGPPSRFSQAAAPQQNDAQGEQRTALFLLDFQNDPLKPSRQEIEEMVFTAPKSVAALIKEASYGKSWITGESFGWYSVPGKNCELSQDELISFLSAKADLRRFDRVLVFNNFDSKNCPAKNLGHTLYFGKKRIQTPQGEANLGIAQFNIAHRLVRPLLPFQPLSGLTGSVIAHELLHSLGVSGHANLLDCGTEALSADPSRCTQAGIADMFSIMGGEGFYRPATHPGACHKESLGWLDDRALLTVAGGMLDEPDGLVVTLFPFERIPENGPIAVKIPLETPYAFPAQNGTLIELSALYLEYRTPLGFDSRLESLAAGDLSSLYTNIEKRPSFYRDGAPIDIGGIQIRAGLFREGRCNTSYLLDPKQGSIAAINPAQEYSLYDSLDAFLNPGQSLLEPINGIRISAEALTREGAIRIRILRESAKARPPHSRVSAAR